MTSTVTATEAPTSSVEPAFLESVVVRPIDHAIDTSRFKCHENVDWFLKNVACDFHERRITAVTCWLSGNDVAGYVTTSMTTLLIDNAPERDGLGLSGMERWKGGPHHKKFPGLLIGMLGVDERYRGRGLGKEMVRFAIGQARKLSDAAGCRFVTVDSHTTPEAVGLYEGLGFVRLQVQKDRLTVGMYFDLGKR